jgi:hypothetical protein
MHRGGPPGRVRFAPKATVTGRRATCRDGPHTDIRQTKTPAQWPGLSSFASYTIRPPLQPSASVATNRRPLPGGLAESTRQRITPSGNYHRQVGALSGD